LTKNLFKSPKEKRTTSRKSFIQSVPELRKSSTHSPIDFLLDLDTNFAVPVTNEDQIPELKLRTKLSQPERHEITTHEISVDLLNTMQSLREDVKQDIDNLSHQIDENMQLLSTWFSFLNNTGTHFLSNVRFSALEDDMETKTKPETPKLLSVEPISRLFPERVRSKVNTILYDYLEVPIVICLSRDALNWVPLTDEYGNQEWYLANSTTQEGFVLRGSPDESPSVFKFLIDRNRSIRVKRFLICNEGHLHAMYNEAKYSISLSPDNKFIAISDHCSSESDLPKVEHKVQVSRMKFQI